MDLRYSRDRVTVFVLFEKEDRVGLGRCCVEYDENDKKKGNIQIGALAGGDQKSRVSELPVITQPFPFLRLRVSDKYILRGGRLRSRQSTGAFSMTPSFVCTRGRWELVF